VAALAKEIVNLSKKGDRKSLEIIKLAAQELASLVVRTREVIGKAAGPVVFGGGIAKSSQEIVSEIESILGITLQVSSDDLSLDAARFAVEDFGSTS
jgi:N-acetylglucosamine kinase-like BadF-type ATPase